jgi:hypothetical protein
MFTVSEISLYLLEVSICSFSKAESEIKTTLFEAVGSYKAFSKPPGEFACTQVFKSH